MGAGKVFHRGAANDPVAFPTKFIQARLRGFEKDMRICLTGVPRKDNPLRLTHAYFPALISCCGTLEYLASLWQGNVNRARGHDDISRYAAKFMIGYDGDTIRILWSYFRHKVAHHGIASGVWCDRASGRRITWEIEEFDRAPALLLVPEVAHLIRDPPWPTRYTHRMYIRLGRFWLDIKDSATGYLAELASSKELQSNFDVCMRSMYPK